MPILCSQYSSVTSEVLRTFELQKALEVVKYYASDALKKLSNVKNIEELIFTLKCFIEDTAQSFVESQDRNIIWGAYQKVNNIFSIAIQVYEFPSLNTEEQLVVFDKFFCEFQDILWAIEDYSL